jgi:hypothetical protein
MSFLPSCISRNPKSAYLHADSSDYGWGAVLHDDPNYQARGFWNAPDRQHYITWKELRALRHAIKSFLPQLKGRNVLLPEDNTAVLVATLTKLTTRSHVMMTEMRRLWYLLDSNNIHIRPRYIRSAANIWADTMSCALDTRTDNSTRDSSHTYMIGGAPTLSTASRLCSTLSCRASAPDGATLSAKTSTVYTSPTRHGAAKTTIAVLLGLLSQPSLPN